MAQHDDDRVHAAGREIIDARFDHSLFSEGKERFESAHALGTTSGQKDGSNVLTCSFFGLGPFVLGLSHKSPLKTDEMLGGDGNTENRTKDQRPKAKDQRPIHDIAATSLSARNVYCRAICLRH